MKFSNQRWSILLLLISITSTSAFVPSSRTTFFTKLHQEEITPIPAAEAETEDQPLSFDDAVAKVKEEDDSARTASRGIMMEAEAQRYNEKKETYNAMRDKIRSRATDLNMNKSVATQEAIKAATQRAAAGEQASATVVDLSKFNNMDQPEDELTDEQMKEIDKVGQMSLVDQVKEELKNTRFPSPDATLKQAVLMLVIFLVTATVILKADDFLRFQYTDWGFIPKSGEVLDYSDLTLPEGFTDQMTDNDLASF
jgi:preprotein translocase subunit SecE